MKKKDLNRSESEERALNSFILDKYLHIKDENNSVFDVLGQSKPKDLNSNSAIRYGMDIE